MTENPKNPLDNLKGVTRRVEDAIGGINKSLHDLYYPAEGKLTALENAMIMGILIANATQISKYLNAALIDDEKIDFRQNIGAPPEAMLEKAKSKNPDDRISVLMTSLIELLIRTDTGSQLMAQEIYKKENPPVADA